MDGTNGEKVKQLAASAWFAVLGRSFMILCAPLLGFVLVSLIDLKTDMKVLQVTLESQKASMEVSSKDSYKATDAIRDGKLIQLQADELKRRIEILEGQIKPIGRR